MNAYLKGSDVLAFYTREAETSHDVIDALGALLCPHGAPRVVDGEKQTVSQRLAVVLKGARQCHADVERLRLLILERLACGRH